MSRTAQNHEVLTLPEAAEYLRLPVEQVKHLASRGLMPCRQIDDQDWRFLKAALGEWLRGRGSASTWISQWGIFADDETLPHMLKSTYVKRRQPRFRSASGARR